MANGRPIWKGVISFGMVSIPVKLFSAIENKDLPFHRTHRDCGSRVKQKNTCPVHETDLAATDMERVFEYAKGRDIPITDADLDSLPVPTKHTVELTAFVEAGSIDPVFSEKSYWLEPEQAGVKPYTLLLRTLQAKGVVGIGKVALRKKESICALRPYRGVLLVEALYWPDEIREPEPQYPVVEPSEVEMTTAAMLVDALRQPFDPSQYRDEYRQALLDLIQSKQDGEPTPTTPVVVVPQQGTDLMAQLRASLEAARAAKAPPPEPEPKRRRRAAA